MFFRELKIIFQITLWKINKFWQIQQTEMLKVNTTKLKTKICSTERRKACANNRTQKKFPNERLKESKRLLQRLSRLNMKGFSNKDTNYNSSLLSKKMLFENMPDWLTTHTSNSLKFIQTTFFCTVDLFKQFVQIMMVGCQPYHLNEIFINSMFSLGVSLEKNYDNEVKTFMVWVWNFQS